MPGDTLLVRALTAGIVELLHDDLTWQVVHGRAAPWTVVVQDSTDIHWSRVQRGLRDVLVWPDPAGDDTDFPSVHP